VIDWKNQNDVVYSVAKRAKEIASWTIDELRLFLSSSAYDNLHAARVEFLGVPRGEMIEQILVEEFVNDDNPRQLEEDG